MNPPEGSNEPPQRFYRTPKKGSIAPPFGPQKGYGEALKGLYLKVLLSKHRSIACPLPLALASDLPCGVCTCKWDWQLLSPGWLWTDFPRPRGWRVTTALGHPFPCGTALGNPFPCRKVCFSQKAPLDKPPLRLPEVTLPPLQKHFVNIFFVFAWEFCIEKWRVFFGEFFLVSVSHEMKHENSSNNSGKIRNKTPGQNSGQKFEKFGELSFCDFSHLKKGSMEPL